MRSFAALAILLACVGLTAADDFFGSITKVDGNKITVEKFKKGEKPETVTLTAAASVKVTRAKFGFKKKPEDGEAVEGGLKNKLFDKATVMARITTEDDKVTAVAIFNVTPNNQFTAIIKKIDGKKITFTKAGFGFGPPAKNAEEMTLTVAAGLKVTKGKYNQESKKMEYTPVEDGLKDEAFSKENVRATFITNDDNRIAEIRLTTFNFPKKPKE